MEAEWRLANYVIGVSLLSLLWFRGRDLTGCVSSLQTNEPCCRSEVSYCLLFQWRWSRIYRIQASILLKLETLLCLFSLLIFFVLCFIEPLAINNLVIYSETEEFPIKRFLIELNVLLQISLGLLKWNVTSLMLFDSHFLRAKIGTFPCCKQLPSKPRVWHVKCTWYFQMLTPKSSRVLSVEIWKFVFFFFFISFSYIILYSFYYKVQE